MSIYSQAYISILMVLILSGCNPKDHSDKTAILREKYRGQVHFSPKENWMNGPAGFVYTDNQYHLYYPYSTTNAGKSTHWGHAVSPDLIHWTHQPVALYPDSQGAIFSGCVVVDEENTSGFGIEGNPPWVAIYTYHNYENESSGSLDVESQGLAYSLDKGETWEKYDCNPILKSQGFRDFRHPKVCWDELTRQWIMVLAADNRIHFYTSPDLIEWRFASDYGRQMGSENDLWESPDLFQIPVKGSNETRWVLMISMGFGATGEWGTGYFTGNFDGTSFIPDQATPLWIDYGQDNYAGVTCTHMPDNRTVLVGWMNNWEYAAEVPTQTWHGSTTIPRELALEFINGYYMLTSEPVREIETLYANQVHLSDITAIQDIEKDGVYNVTPRLTFPLLPSEINLRFKTDDMVRMGYAEKFGVKLSNEHGEHVIIGYDSFNRLFYVDRSRSMINIFSGNFIGKHILPFTVDGSGILDMRLILDETSFELFAMDGKVVMTDTFYPSSAFNRLELFAENGKVTLENISVAQLKSIWE